MPAGSFDTLNGVFTLIVNGNGLVCRAPVGEFVREVRQNDDVLRWRMSGARMRLTTLVISANRICLTLRLVESNALLRVRLVAARPLVRFASARGLPAVPPSLT